MYVPNATSHAAVGAIVPVPGRPSRVSLSWYSTRAQEGKLCQLPSWTKSAYHLWCGAVRGSEAYRSRVVEHIFSASLNRLSLPALPAQCCDVSVAETVKSVITL